MEGIKMYSQDAEESVLGCLLLDEKISIQYVHRICEEDFYVSDSKLMFRAIKECMDKGRSADLVTVSSLFPDDERERLSLLCAECAARVPTVAAMENYFVVLKEMAERRRIYKTLTEGISLISEGKNSGEVLPEVLSKLARKEEGASGCSLSESVIEFYDDLGRRYKGDRELAGIETGFSRLDALLGGMQRGELVVLGARPSVGKSVFAGSVFLNVGFKLGLPSMFFSYEMPRLQIVRRMVSAKAHVKNMDMRLGNLTEGDFEKIARAVNGMSGARCEIHEDCPDFNELRYRASAFRAREGDLGIIIIDYLQLMPGRGKSLRDVVEYNSRMLKRLAKELNCVILVLSQLSRAVEGRATEEPYLSDLRESGAIEQDADVVLLLYRDEEHRKVKVAKARDGDLGTVSLLFLKDYVLLAEPRMTTEDKKKVKGPVPEEESVREEVDFPDI